jgi:hypothetical protein
VYCMLCVISCFKCCRCVGVTVSSLILIKSKRELDSIPKFILWILRRCLTMEIYGNVDAVQEMVVC